MSHGHNHDDDLLVGRKIDALIDEANDLVEQLRVLVMNMSETTEEGTGDTPGVGPVEH